MISICIPVYNCCIGDLVSQVREQSRAAQITIEIVVIDDASDMFFQQENLRFKELTDQFIMLPLNIGRSRIRNHFLQYAQFEYLLFLDCDVLPVKKDFLEAYHRELPKQQTVIYGGRVFPDRIPDSTQLLRWEYGRMLESKPAAVRQLDPYRNFHSNNFLIRKSILENIRFDESLKGYGYEDSLFSQELQQRGIPIKHLENPVLHPQLEKTDKFLHNIDESILNLASIQSKHDMSKVVRLVKIFQRYQLLIGFIPAGVQALLRKRLLHGSSSLRLLQLYKLISFRRAFRVLCKQS